MGGAIPSLPLFFFLYGMHVNTSMVTLVDLIKIVQKHFEVVNL
jgi:hypothetical protein